MEKSIKHSIPKKLAIFLFIIDIFALFISLIIGGYLINLIYFFMDSNVSLSIETYKHFGILFFCAVLYYGYRGHFTSRVPWWQKLLGVVKTNLSIIFFSLFFYYSIDVNIRLIEIAVFWVTFTVCLTLIRKVGLSVIRLFKDWKLPVILIGDQQMVTDCIYALYADGQTGYAVKSVFHKGPPNESLDLSYIPKNHPEISIYDFSNDFEEFKKIAKNYYIVIGLDSFRGKSRDDLILFLEQNNIEYAITPPVKRLQLYGNKPRYFFGNDFMLLRRKDASKKYISKFLKRMMDITVGSFALLCLSPLIIFVLIFKKLEKSETPIFYGGKRVGLNGELFSCWKFCTMRKDADKVLQEVLDKDPEAKKEWELFKKLRNDPRIDSKISHFLRKTSLDEIPQIWNIVVGDMSLVGPRPILPEQIKDYGNNFIYYKSTRPGLTGVWQVSGRNETTFEQRVYWDSWYIKNWSLWNDAVILLKTVSVVLTRHGAF